MGRCKDHRIEKPELTKDKRVCSNDALILISHPTIV